MSNSIVHFGASFLDLLYADDTLLLANDTRVMNILIKEIEIESTKYNMKLNKKKCNFIAINCSKPNVHFSDGTKLSQVEQAVYLGGILHKT